MNKETVEKILKETEKGYDLISKKFSETRKRFWGNLEFIKDYSKEGDRILDYGCGNGRLLELFCNTGIDYIGMDVSEKLIEAAKKQYEQCDRIGFLKINPHQTSLSFPDNYFNSVYSIAVFHHIPSEELRVEIARELRRVLKPGEHIIVTAWNLWQPRYRKNVYRNWMQKIFGKSELDWNDCYISFTDNEGQKFNRYHHAFTVRDMKNLFLKAGFEIEKCEIIGGRNVVLIGRKV